MKVPFFDYPQLYKIDKSSYLSIFDTIGQKGAFILQTELTEFENSLSRYTKSKHAIGVANATDGLEIAWQAVELKPGYEVIVSAHTMVATASAIVTHGGIPRVVDIAEDGLIDVNAIEASINEKTFGISPTHLNGRTCDMDSIMKLANKYGLKVIEDAAQSLGSKFRQKNAGTFGDASSISFFPAKILGCLGDGGAILTNSKTLFEKIYALRDHGRDTSGNIVCWGRNSRLDNLQASFLNLKLQDFEKIVQRRRQIALNYQMALQQIEQVKLPPGPSEKDDHYDAYQNYEIQVERRGDLINHLKEKGVGTIIQWGGKGLHQWGLPIKHGELEAANTFFEKCLLLPMNIFLSDDDVNYVSEQIISFYKK